jgi:hypothetical protein
MVADGIDPALDAGSPGLAIGSAGAVAIVLSHGLRHPVTVTVFCSVFCSARAPG